MEFIDNKYTKWYNEIIYKARTRLQNNSGYTERHHIVPKSLGGSNSSENIVTLSAREHFICHMLLTRMTCGSDKSKMIHAAIGMKRKRLYQERYINSRLYEIVRKEFAEIARARNKGKVLSDAIKEKMSIASKGKQKSKIHAENISKTLTGLQRGPMPTNEREKRSIANKGKPSPNKGNSYSLTDEQRAKISESNRRRKLSRETKEKISASLRSRKNNVT